MKKTILFLALASLTLVSCRKDDPDSEEPEVSIETQNLYDDQAALNFLETHYLDVKGNVKAFSESDESDDNNTKLSELNPKPVTLPSGVIYIVREGVQPDPGTEIGSSDIIKIMSNITTYVAVNSNDKITFSSPSVFNDQISSGNVETDPAYYYVKNSVLKAYNEKYSTSYDHSYYEIEGFREALQKFKAFDIPEESNYNLQGVIIVPSRAAFARDAHFNYTGIAYRNRSFIFNFQIYKTSERPEDQD